ncbi:50S ribosomal protein L1 [Candidatus Woesearchaeota archaeon]|nr:50S ribosomal protein L1 [Candidatus Woesearchaeota archaeon]
MEIKEIQAAIKKARDASKKRKFNQTFDLVVNLKSIDMKKNRVEFFTDLHHERGKQVKVCALVGPELLDQAKKTCDHAVSSEEFADLDKKKIKELAKAYDFFIAQATIMPKIAQTFGRVFGPLGKMPNPKAGCVVPPNANLKPLYDKLQRMVKVSALKQPVVQCAIGTEALDDKILADNYLTVYKALLNNLPNRENNIKTGFLKLTMGPAIGVE